MSDGGIEQAAQAVAKLIYDAPFRTYAPNFLMVEDEKGNLVPFELNEAQLIVDREVERQLSLGRPVRVLILKGRQQGMSTYVSGRIARRVFTRTGTKAHVIGHALASIHGLYDKLARAHRELYGSLHPDLRGALGLHPPATAPGGERGRRITFEDPLRTSVRYDSAHDPEGVGRGLTSQVVHLTETPQFKKADETVQSILATISDDPDTEVYVENTAKGASGWFYETWLESHRLMEQGVEPEFVCVFVPWFKTPRYSRQRRPGEPGLDTREQAFRDQYELTEQQVLWYRDQRRKYGERVTEEYPSNWREAFLSSGMPFFQREALSHYRECRRRPDRKGRWRGYKAGAQMKYQFTKDEYGPTHIYEAPIDTHRYTVGVDFASGRAKDHSGIVVIDVETKHVVAVHRSQNLPDDILVEAMLLGKAYGNAMIVPERSGIGQALVDRLVNEFRYPNVYREHDPVAVKFHGGARYGFATSTGTKPWLMEELAHQVHTRALEIPDERIVEELGTFVYLSDDGKKIGAADGCNDDMVMALAMAVRGMSRAPLSRAASQSIKPQTRTPLFGAGGY